MKKMIIAIFCTFFFTHHVCQAAVSPSPVALQQSTQNVNPLLLSPAQLEKITGRHMNLVQRLEWKLLQRKLRNHPGAEDVITEKQRHQATASLILGIASLVLLFLPYAALVAVPAAIVGLILGIKSIKGNSNAKGIIGIVFSGLTLALFLLAIILVAAFLAGGF